MSIPDTNIDDFSMAWLNESIKYGDNQFHITSLVDLLQIIRAPLSDMYPAQVLDGYCCINETTTGRSNYNQIRQLVVHQIDPEEKMKEIMNDVSNQDGLIDHPLLRMDNVSSFLGDDLIRDLKEVKCFVISETFENAREKIHMYHSRMCDLI